MHLVSETNRSAMSRLMPRIHGSNKIQISIQSRTSCINKLSQDNAVNSRQSFISFAAVLARKSIDQSMPIKRNSFAAGGIKGVHVAVQPG